MPRKKSKREDKAKSSEVTDKEVIRHEPANSRLIMRVQIDGKDHRKIARNVTSTDPVAHQAILDSTAASMQRAKDDGVARKGVGEVAAGRGDWAALPEGPDKQRIAQQAMRDVVAYAREGKQLQKDGQTRPEAYQRYASTRNIKSRIWDQLDYIGNHPDKAAYLALAGPGPGTEYGTLLAYFNDLGNAAPDWNAVATFMQDCANPIEIDSPMTV